MRDKFKDSDIGKINVVFGWCWLFLGILGAMWIGLHAFTPDWLGGYASLSRRLLRLGHIAFMALSLTNVLYGFCLDSVYLPVRLKRTGSLAMIITAVGMPLSCLVSMLDISFRFIFSVPVISFCVSVLIMIIGQIKSVQYESERRG